MSELKALDKNLNLIDKRVILRVDLNVPIKEGKVTDKSRINNPKCKNAIQKAKSLIKGKGRMLVRKSGTEPVVRIMCEIEDKTMLSKCINIVKKSII